MPRKSEAPEHLDLAIPELRDMKMQPSLERALALREIMEPATVLAPARESASDTLTTREREIASSTADGLSNHDIAEGLVISEGTFEVHVKHILGKLGFRSCAQVAGWLAQCAHRELHEETGLDLPLTLTTFGTTEWPHYLARAPSDAVVVLDAEHDRFEWVAAASAPARCSPELTRQPLEAVIEQLPRPAALEGGAFYDDSDV
jgi:DNA-binding CsgD family transcriptional regulator